MSLNPHKILGHFLSYRERTAWEVRKKLQEKGLADQDIEKLIAEYIESGLIDDEGFALKMVVFGFEKGHGMKRIKLDAKKKGIKDCDLDKALMKYEEEEGLSLEEAELAAMDKLIFKFMAGENEAPSRLDDRALSRLAGRLARAGHRTHRIYQAIGDIKRGDYDDQ